jgi:nitrite reductase/ring-hydroxylating ferredoxin subunit
MEVEWDLKDNGKYAKLLVGYEYDMKTGEHVSNRKLKLRKYDVVQKGNDVYVVA